MPIAQLVKRMSPKGWAMLGGSAAVAVLFIFLLMQFASAPSYSTLMTGLDPAQTGKMTTTLSTAGIGYQLQNNGTALAVVSGQTAQARVALATAGLLGAQSQPGFSLFDNQALGQSDFQQQITYQRALEGQLATTIEGVNGVSTAEVQLVLPSTQDQLFADNSSPATAAVELSGSGSLDSSSVRGIAQLVASSVPGLALDKVTVTDGSGQLLWPTSNSSDSGGLVASQAANQTYDAAMAAQVDAMLATTLGVGKAQVTVNADLNANQATSDTLAYAKKGVALTQQTQVETLTGTGGAASGVAGTAGNIPAYTTGTGSGNSNYKNQTANTTFGVDKTVTHAVIAPGNINQQSVSVLVDKSVPASALPAIKAAVSNAVGLQIKRGDTLSMGQLAFVKPTVTPAAAKPSSMMTYAKYGIIGLMSLLFLVFVGRLLRRREREAFAGQPTWLRELESPRSLAAIEARQQAGLGSGQDPTDLLQLKAPVNVAKRQVEELVKRDPERVAQQVRAWMQEED
jgi:flagellar M-ring protein FliF